MASLLFPLISKFADDAWRQLDDRQITPWAFFNSTGVKLTRFGGGEIAIVGPPFSGSAVDFFWVRYIEPFLEDAAIRAFENTRRLANERKLDLRQPLEETAGAMIGVSRKAFARMASIDRRLRGGGFPETVSLRDTAVEEAVMETFIRRLLHAELATEHRWRRFESFVQRYPTLWTGFVFVGGCIFGFLAKWLHG